MIEMYSKNFVFRGILNYGVNAVWQFVWFLTGVLGGKLAYSIPYFTSPQWNTLTNVVDVVDVVVVVRRKCQSDFVHASSCAQLQKKQTNKHVCFANILLSQWLLVVIAWISIINSLKPKCRCQLHAIQPNMIHNQSQLI